MVVCSETAASTTFPTKNSLPARENVAANKWDIVE
jgi:hypothetical protein